MSNRPSPSIIRRSACALALAAAAAACDSPSAAKRECGSGVRLEVGDAVALSPGEEPCLAAEAGADYVLAYLDARGLELARGGNETYRPANGGSADDAPFSLRITVDGPAASRAARGSVAVDPHSAPALGMDADLTAEVPALATSPFAAPGAWATGDTFSVNVPCIGCAAPTQLAWHATVASVQDDWLAIAAVDGLPAADVAAFHTTLRSAWQTARTHAMPLLQHALAPGRPVTTPAGRLLVLIEPDLGEYSGWAQTGVDGDQVFGYIRLKLDTQRGHASMARLLAHELAHLYQRMHHHGTRTGNSTTGLGPALWGSEGTADLVGYETIRRAGGLPLAGNYDWRTPGSDAFAGVFARLAQPNTAEFSRGYGHSMGFLRRLVVQRVAAGESVDDAMREVVRGGVEGWYGNDGRGSIRPGLAARMAQRLAGWQPEDALLEWTLSHAADDWTASPRFQDAAFLRIGEIPGDHNPAWRPDGVIDESGTHTVRRRWGGSGYTYLRDTGPGIRFRLVAETAELRWMLMRVK